MENNYGRGSIMALMKSSSIFLALALVCSASASTLFSSRAAFQAQLGSAFTDDYENPAYQVTQTDAQMTAVFGQTQYTATEFANVNTIAFAGTTLAYCSGCNGSFMLGFGHTSFGPSTGVFGVGFDLLVNQTDGNAFGTTYDAFVTYGDGSTQDIKLPELLLQQQMPFFTGITDSRGISSIYFGNDGQPAGDVLFEIDNLTIGSATAPEPGPLFMLGLGMAVLGIVGKRSTLRRN